MEIKEVLRHYILTKQLKLVGSYSGRVFYKGTYWKPVETIRIKFLNGDKNMSYIFRNKKPDNVKAIGFLYILFSLL